MMDRERYLPSFLTEMDGYLRVLREQIQRLASPTRFGSAAETVLQTLRHLGHTIDGLSTTLDLPDFALLSLALEELARAYQATNDPVPVALAPALTYLTVHMDARLNRMSSANHLLAPDDGEQREAQRIADTIAALTPDVVPVSTTANPPFVLVSDIAQVTQKNPTETAPTMAVDDDELPALPAEIQALVDAFLQADLTNEISAIRPTGLPPTADVVQDFVVELTEDLAHMRRALVALQGDSHPHLTLRELGERAHKLKGAAYMVGMLSVGAMSDMLETLLLALRQSQAPLDASAEHWLITCVAELDTLGARIAATQADHDATAALARLHEGYARIMAAAAEPPTTKRPAVGPVGDPLLAAAPSASSAHQSSTPMTLRVEPQRLDRLMTTISNMLLNQSEMDRLQGMAASSEGEFERAITRVIDLYDRLRAERVAAISHRASRTFGNIGWDSSAPIPQSLPLPPALEQWKAQQALTPPSDMLATTSDHLDLDRYSEFDLLMAMVGEVVSDLRAVHLNLQTALNQLKRQHEHRDFLTESLQRDVLSLRLAPIAEMLPRLQLAARATALAEGKEVEWVANGADIEIDAEIFAALDEHLVQIIRNAVVHGIETPEERREAGKFDPARITITASQAGDGVTIAISDNGRGINPHRIITAAVVASAAQGTPLSQDDVRQLSPEQVLDLMFLPDVSTASEVKPNAGRGMGLPSIKRAVESVRGTITVTSTLGQGTTFHIHLPTSLGILRGVVISTGAQTYAVPVAAITRTTLLDPAAIVLTPDGARATIPDLLGGTQEMPVISLPDLLGHPEIAAQSTLALIFTVDRQEYAVAVDAIAEDRDMVVRRVPRHLRRRGVRGATITAQNDVLLILDMPEMIAQAVTAGRFGALPTPTTPPVPIVASDHILIVDDSPSIRRGIERILTDAGYQTAAARDGVDAIDQMTRALPRLLILDVEMPQLNGYELLDVIRTHAPFRDVRAIMLTSRAAPRYREHALRLGATEYLVKPVAAEQLLAAVAAALSATMPESL